MWPSSIRPTRLISGAAASTVGRKAIDGLSAKNR